MLVRTLGRQLQFSTVVLIIEFRPMERRHLNFNYWKGKGNAIFVAVYNDWNLPPVAYQKRMSEALQFYYKALTLSFDDGNVASILKNIAATQFRIGKRLYDSLNWNVASKMKINDIQYFLEQSLDCSYKCLSAARYSKDSNWKKQVEGRGTECAELMWQFLVQNPQYMSDDNQVLAKLNGRLFQICQKAEGFIRGKLFLNLGCFCFHKAIQYQAGADHKKAVQLLKDNYTAIEEAKQHLRLLAEATDLEESTLIHLSISESAMARERGQSKWTRATRHSEELDMEGVWDAIDDLCQSIILSRGKCLESEAISHGQLGEIYRGLRYPDKSKEHYKAAVDLAQAMQPRNFNGVYWYDKCLTGLKAYQDQQKWKEQNEQEKLRAPIKEKLKPVLEELKDASNKSAKALLNLIYSKHPPKRGSCSTEDDLKSKLKKALLHYHPDKQDVEEHGIEWIVLAEQITVHLTHHFGRFKGA